MGIDLRFKSLTFFLILAVPSLVFSVDLPSVSTSLVRIEPGEFPSFKDDGDLKSLRDSAGQSLKYYSALPPNSTFSFGQTLVSGEELVETLESLVDFIDLESSAKELSLFLKENFDVYRSLGTDGKGQVIFSAYHEHTLTARLAPTAEYRFPLYSRPKDLVDVPLENFDPKRRGERIAGRLDGTSLVPYYSREDIDSKGVLKGKGLEIAWAKDPLEILFLQIQGSGWVQVAGTTETYHIRYAGDNGRPYSSVGYYLIESSAIPKKDFSRAKLAGHLSRQTEERRQKILNVNARYIFFEMVSPTNTTRGSLMVSLTPGRSIASDPKLYPPGALAWIKTIRPRFDPYGTAVGTETLSRLVLNQDEGGAIKGAGRIDFFAGGGKEAERFAQKMWNSGELYFFVKKRRP